MKFIITFAITTLIALSTLYGLILAVDPYNKFGFNLFNFPTKAVDFARENKFNQVEYSKKNYTGFIMGSSSAHRFDTKDLNKASGLEFYNYSTQSATPEDFIAMTRHLLSRFKPKMIVISFDMEVLNKRIKTDDMFYSSPLVNYLKEAPEREIISSLFNNSYFTLEALADSFQVIWVNLFGTANHAYLEDGNHVGGAPVEKINVKQFNFGNFTLDERRVSYLKTIKELCDKNEIKVIVFTSPLSLEAVQRLDNDPSLKEGVEITKKVLVDIFGGLWDFIDQESVRGFNTPEYWIDSNHPTHRFSGIIAERIFRPETHPNLGKQILK